MIKFSNIIKNSGSTNVINLRDRNLKILSFFDIIKERKKEVKTYKGYVLTGIDGSDFEIPNTKSSRERYNGKQQIQCSRVTV